MNNLYLIIGPSGIGKTTLQTRLERDYKIPGVQSYTTRPKRAEDETGHIFVNNEQFDILGPFVGYTEYNGYRYGVTEEILDKCDIYVIDPAGAELLLKLYRKRPVHILWLYNSESSCAYRMLRRGDSVDDMYRRIVEDRSAFANEIKERIFEQASGHTEIYASLPWIVTERVIAYMEETECCHIR